MSDFADYCQRCINKTSFHAQDSALLISKFLGPLKMVPSRHLASKQRKSGNIRIYQINVFNGTHTFQNCHWTILTFRSIPAMERTRLASEWAHSLTPFLANLG